MTIKVFVTNNCGGCDWTMAQLKGKGLDYEEIKVTADDAETLEMLRNNGLVGFPAVVVNDFEQSWSGVNPQAIEELV